MEGLTKKQRRAELGRRFGVCEPQFVSIEHKLRDEHGLCPIYTAITDSDSSLCFQFDWTGMPRSATPEGAGLPVSRVARKTVQVLNMIFHARRLIREISGLRKPGTRLCVVEFCAGTGSICLPLALTYPEHDFVLLDCKDDSLKRAHDRVLLADIPNVKIVKSRVEDYDSEFDIGLALHACGSASDYVIEKCLSGAGFVICSCCVGKISKERQRPLSTKFNNAMNNAEFCCLVQAADFGHNDLAAYTDEKDRRRRCCKALVEFDRYCLAQEKGYICQLFLMVSGYASPKCDVLVGFPPGCSIERVQSSTLLVHEPIDKYLFTDPIITSV